jgi:phage terminase small subunit
MAHAEENLKGKQGTFLTALLAEPTVKEAAEAAGVSPRTAWRYLADPAFQKEYRAARREVTEHTVMRLQADSAHAAKVLRDIADDTTAPASARVSACRTIIEQGLKGAELREVMQRLDELEKTIEERKPKR